MCALYSANAAWARPVAAARTCRPDHTYTQGLHGRQCRQSLGAISAAAFVMELAVGGGRDAAPGTASMVTPGVVPLATEDVACPICRDKLDGVVTTPCGHSFCFRCITTHLGLKKSCPSCGNYLTEDRIHPNFLLNKVAHGSRARVNGHAADVCGTSNKQPT